MEGIFQSTVEGKYLTVNPALARMYGYSFTGGTDRETSSTSAKRYMYRPRRREEFKRIIEGNGFVEAFESEIFKKDGTKIWISENARAVVDASGKIASYEGTVEDITDRKRSESERQVITEIVHAVSVTDNLDDLLRRVHSALQSVLSAENCFVALYEPSTGVFNFPFFADRTQPTPPPQMVWRSCAAYVYRAGRPMLIPPQLFYELVEQEEVESFGEAACLLAGRAAARDGRNDRSIGGSELRAARTPIRSGTLSSCLPWAIRSLSPSNESAPRDAFAKAKPACGF